MAILQQICDCLTITELKNCCSSCEECDTNQKQIIFPSKVRVVNFSMLHCWKQLNQHISSIHIKGFVLALHFLKSHYRSELIYGQVHAKQFWVQHSLKDWFHPVSDSNWCPTGQGIQIFPRNLWLPRGLLFGLQAYVTEGLTLLLSVWSSALSPSLWPSSSVCVWSANLIIVNWT